MGSDDSVAVVGATDCRVFDSDSKILNSRVLDGTKGRRREWMRTLGGPIDGNELQNSDAIDAMNAGVAVAHCTGCTGSPTLGQPDR